MPEGLFQDHEINIKDLSIEQPQRPEQGLDLESVIDREVWEKLKSVLADYLQAGNIEEFLKLAKEMVCVYPDRKAELGLDDTVWQKIKTYWESYDFISPLLDNSVRYGGIGTTASDLGGMLTPLAWTKLVFPEEMAASSYGSSATNEAVELLKSNIDKVAGIDSFMDLAVAIRILTGNPSVLAIDSNGARYMTEALVSAIATKWSTLRIMNLAANGRILLGEQYDSTPITDEHWARMADEMNEMKREGGWETNLINSGADLKILAAEKVLVNQHGLELIMPTPASTAQETPKRPEARRF
jgi:hypothetical protein